MVKIKNSSESNLESKLKAIKIITEELEGLKEDDRLDILSFVLKQLKLDGSMINIDNSGLIESNLPSVGSDTTINDTMDKFVSRKKPTDLYQRIAVIAFYLKFKEGKDEFKNSEIDKINTVQARQPKIGNIADVIAKAQNRHKFLTRGISPATHQLSILGEEIVSVLPNQDEVKRLIMENRPKRRRKKLTKKSKAVSN
ncbi:MAG: hypothetical protein AAB757_01705 [Patescibacteria group bacterium]